MSSVLDFFLAFLACFFGVLAAGGLVYLIAMYDPYHTHGKNRKKN